MRFARSKPRSRIGEKSALPMELPRQAVKMPPGSYLDGPPSDKACKPCSARGANQCRARESDAPSARVRDRARRAQNCLVARGQIAVAPVLPTLAFAADAVVWPFRGELVATHQTSTILNALTLLVFCDFVHAIEIGEESGKTMARPGVSRAKEAPAADRPIGGGRRGWGVSLVTW